MVMFYTDYVMHFDETDPQHNVLLSEIVFWGEADAHCKLFFQNLQHGQNRNFSIFGKTLHLCHI